MKKLISLLLALTALTAFYFFSVMSIHKRLLGAKRNLFSALSYSLEAEKTRMPSVINSMDRIGCPFYPRTVEDVRFMITDKSMQDLKSTAAHLNSSKPITLLLSNEASSPLLANWLCVAKEKMKNVSNNLLIIVPHENSSLEESFAKKGLNTVSMKFSEFCLSNMQEEKKSPNIVIFKQSLMARYASVYLLTTWGYDVVVYDPDALIIRDPTPLYTALIEKYDPHIIAQKGAFPDDVRKQWGFALVLGHVLYRSALPVKQLWKKLADVQYISKDFDDQRLTNLGITMSHPKWRKAHLYNSSLGVCATGLRVVALGEEYSYRGRLEEPLSSAGHLHVYHPLLGHRIEEKIARLKTKGLWNVRGNALDSLSNNTIYSSPYQWLQNICTTPA